MLIRVLVLLEAGDLRRRVEALLQEEKVAVESLGKGEDLWQRLRGEDAELLIAGLSQAPSPPEEWVASLRQLPERPEIIFLAEEENAHRRAALLAAGAYAVLNTGLGGEELARALRTMLRRMKEDATERLKAARLERSVGLGDFVTASRAMQQVMATARRVARSDATILLLGETGVGKERLARAIHRESPRSEGPFLPLNCSALPEGILESELFGHEKGAFTGASRARRGYFELAHGGTLFLDEIGELPPHLQVKLLRTLEDRTVQRLGGERSTRVDVRIMAATNRDLERDIHARRFRADLFYRLAVVSLTLPPLRERREDMPDLIDSYLEHFRRAFASPVRGIRADALETLLAYAWPGNVRELINVLERAVLLAQGELIVPADLPGAIVGPMPREALPARDDGAVPGAAPLKRLREARQEVVAAFEREYLARLLRETRGRIGSAARSAGVNERTLYDLLLRHGLRKEQFKT
jgi:DNA-binding NtrC family response regulator